MKKVSIVLGSLVLAAFLAWRLVGGSAGLVDAALPEFPDYPSPPEQLAADAAGTVHFASSTPFDLDVLLAGNGEARPTTGIGTLFVPDGDARVPAMVVLHGSGGISPGREMEYGALLAQNGIAALVVDYYAPRGVTRETNYMLRVLSVTEFDAVADAYSAKALLATHPRIDGSRIGVMGFSYGGMAARFAMDDRLRRVLSPDDPGFAAFVDYYGPCFQDLETSATNGAPLLTLRGTEDASNELSACAEREAELRALGVQVEDHVFEGAGHAWEVETPRKLFPDSPYVAGCTVVYDDVGHSSMDGAPIAHAPPGTPRAERIAMRMQSGGVMGGCVQSGYVVGRDAKTHTKTNALLLDFLARHL